MTEPFGSTTLTPGHASSEAQRLDRFAQSAICESIRSLRWGFTMNFLTARRLASRCASATGLPLNKASLGVIMRSVNAALSNGSIDVTDAYANRFLRFKKTNLVVLEDDLRFFPKYTPSSCFDVHVPGRNQCIAPARRTLDKNADSPEMGPSATKNYTFAANLYFAGLRKIGELSGLKPFRTSFRAWTCATSSSQAFRCCFQLSSGFRLALLPAAVESLAGYSWLCQQCANDPVSRPAGIAVPVPFSGSVFSYFAITALFL